ncbi:uncharacterized protein LOC105390507 isoform X2 [Plutella xylostella]|uniref:uncharacterized protein LOC105390507 isoform X2 n=1 Tax=Plutella xylostella TaxID=51655 RepID=UPI0020324460|nr:uncharacterized protein LOC105390507 isoform X2 [Plutella xylostella]
MERLSHDLNLALEESNCVRHERRKIGMRRRTRSAGNLPAVAISVAEDGSSSSPPQAPLITQPLSDSDDPLLNPHKTGSLKARHYCQIGAFESDSFNENFSPTRLATTRRKRKYKKVPMDFVDGSRSPPIEILNLTAEPSELPVSITLNSGLSSILHTNKHKLSCKERNAFCGKRKWSYRDKTDGCEMRERSFSGGCTSKATFLSKNYDFKTKNLDKKRKESVLQPGKIVLKSQNDSACSPPTFANTPTLPGSSSFNFVYKKSFKNGTPTLNKMTGYKVTTDLPPFFNPIPSSTKNNFDGKMHRKSKLLNKTHPPNSLRNPLQFDDNNGMECMGNESSSLSSSESDGITNDSDREGDDELTDWPGIEELKVFNKSLTFKSSKVNTAAAATATPPKRLKKEKYLSKSGWTGCKNRFKKKRPKVDSGNDEEAMMSDSKTIIDLEDEYISKENILQPHSSFTSFSDVKNAGVLGQNANETFFQSFQAFQEKSAQDEFGQTPRTNFALQKTSSSDLNISEKSPQSDHYFSEHSMGNSQMNDVREIRAGCRRIREERPGFLILSAANEQLSKFLQDSCQTELKLPNLNDPDEREKLESLAKLYSLELKVEMGRPVLRKTCNTTQAIQVEHSYPHLPSDHKRRCYGEDADSSLSVSDQNSVASINDLEEHDIENFKSELTVGVKYVDTFSNSLVDKSLLDPGEID